MEQSKNLRTVSVLDEVDRMIVEHLQRDGRMTNAELAERVGIAASTCVTRVRSLVSRGIITGFMATVDPAVMGRNLQVLVSVTIRSGARQRITEFSDELRALCAGVGMVHRKQRRCLLGSESLKTISLHGCHIDDWNVLGRTDLVLIVAISHIAFDMRLAIGAILPDIANRHGQQNGVSSLGASVRNILAQIPAIGMDRLLGFSGQGSGAVRLRNWNRNGLFTDPLYALPGLGIVQRVAAIVVPHLQKNIVPRLNLRQNMIPQPFVEIAPAAPSCAGAIGHIDAAGIEEMSKVIAPAEVRLIARR